MQQGNTCWFHSIVNGFILSSIGRKFIEGYMSLHIAHRPVRTSRTLRPNNKSVCPRTFNRDFFWSYISNRLKSKVVSPNTNVFRTAAAIKSVVSSAPRMLNVTSKGTSIRREDEIYRGLFGNLYAELYWTPQGPRNDIKIARINFNNKDSIPNKFGNLVLSHCFIILWTPPQPDSHAIAGYLCDGKPFIFDSLSGYYSYDWRKENFNHIILNVHERHAIYVDPTFIYLTKTNVGVMNLNKNVLNFIKNHAFKYNLTNANINLMFNKWKKLSKNDQRALELSLEKKIG